MSLMNLVKELREKSGAGILDCKKALEACDNDVEQALKYLREKGIASAGKKSDRIAAEGLASIAVAGNFAAIIEINSETDFVAKNEMFLELVATVANVVLEAKPANLETALKVEVAGETLENYIATKQAIIGEKINFRRFEIIEKSADQVFGTYLHNGGAIATVVVVTGDDANVAREVSLQVAAMGAKFAKVSEIDEHTLNQEREVLRTQALNEGKPENVVDKMVEGRLRKYYEEVVLEEQKYFKDTDKTMKQFVKEANSEIVSFVSYTVGEGIEKKEDNFVEEVMNQAQI